MKIKSLVCLALILGVGSCRYFSNNTLPVYGEKTAIVKMGNGKEIVDSVDYTLPSFSLLDQDSQWVTNTTTENKIFVAEFFFTACPSICPKMQQQMLRVHDKYKDNPSVCILAFSIDPVRDSVPRLKAYAGKLGADKNVWHFMTGQKDSIYAIADKFLVSAAEDPDAPGGHIHSGNFILVDKQRRLRGYYDGVKEESVTKLLEEIDVLLKEK